MFLSALLAAMSFDAEARAPRAAYAPVDGMNVYYEISGNGAPLVLLHGAFCTIELCFRELVTELSKTRQVVAVELQGHGHTADIDHPLTYGNLAEDVVGVLDHLGIERADIYGYSMGSGVALELAMRHPERVSKLAIAAMAVDRAGMHPGIMDGIEQITPEVFAGSTWEQAYLDAAPDPSDWPALIEKVKTLDREWQGWSADAVRAIGAPTLVIAGDADIVRPEHAVEMLRLFGGGVAGDVVGLPDDELAILPGTTHVGLIERPEWLASMVTRFLDR